MSQAETWGVIRDYDRSAEEPTQMFTARTSSELNLSIPFARLPDAFRVKYIDASNDDAETEKIVWNPDVGPVAVPRLEEITYRGLVSEADVTARAEYDMRQLTLRAPVWSFNAPTEAVVCRRGDLVELNHDILDRTHGSARIESVELNGSGLISALWLDQEVPVWNESDFTQVDDVTDLGDVTDVGRQTAARIRQTDGTFLTKTLSGATADARKISFATPFMAGVESDGTPLIMEGCLVAIGDLGNVTERLIVAGMEDKGDGIFNISAVPEAPQIFA
jgi:hypothetical protein